MTCTIITNSANKIEKVLTPEGVESSLYKQIASMPFIQSADEAIGVYVRSTSSEVQNEINSLEGVSVDPITKEPKLSYRLVDGSFENNYKDALRNNNGGELQVGVRGTNGFVPIQSIQTSVSPNTVMGVINNYILNEMISPMKEKLQGLEFGFSSVNPLGKSNVIDNLFNDLQKVSPNFEIKKGRVVFLESNSIEMSNPQINTNYTNIKFSKKVEVIPSNNNTQDVVNSTIERLKETGLAEEVVIMGTSELTSFLEDLGIPYGVDYQREMRERGAIPNINGFVFDNKVYLNSDTMSLDTPIHEFAHLWNNYTKQNNPVLFDKGINLIKTEGQSYIDFVQQSQPELEGEDLYEEALAQAIGDNGARLIKNKTNGITKWLKEVWDWVTDSLGISDYVDSGDLNKLTLEQFSTAVAIDLLKQKNAPAADLVTKKTYGDSKTKIEVGFLEEAKLKDYIKNDRITIQENLNFLNNTDVFFAGPDDTFVGEASFDFGNGNVKSVTGDGGLYFPMSFEDIWAFKNNGNNTSLTVVNHINDLLERNKKKGIDKTYVVLVKGTDSKGISNPQGIEVALRVLEGMVNSEIIEAEDVKSNISVAIEEAKVLQAKSSLSKKNNRLKSQGRDIESDYTSMIPNFDINIDPTLTIEELKDSIIDFFKNDENIPFEIRKHFMTSLLGGIWKKYSKDKVVVNQIKDFLGFDKSEKLSLKQEFIDGIIKVSSEGRVTKYQSGDVYAAIEVSGEVSARLEGVDGEKVHPVFNGRIVQLDEKGNKVPVRMHLIDGHFKYNEFAQTLDGSTILDASTKTESQSISGKIFGVSQSWGRGTIISKGLDMTKIKFSKSVPENCLENEKNFKEFLDTGSWGMMTGANPVGQTYSEMANYRAFQRSQRFLKELGYNPIVIQGKYGKPEESLFVPGITREDAITFAKEFGQDSVVTDEGMFYRDGSYYPRNKEGDTFNGNYDDLYSTIKIGDKSLSFQIGYDFSDKITPESKDSNSINLPENSTYNKAEHFVSARTRRHLTEDGEGNYVFYHYSPENFEQTDPTKSGSLATSNTETGAWSLAGGVTYFYTDDMTQESMINGSNKFEFKIPKEQVYDADLDVNNYKKEVVDNYIKSHPNNAHPSVNQELALVTKKATEEGFKITTSKWSTAGVRAQSNVPLIPTDRQITEGSRIIKDFGSKYVSNFTKILDEGDVFNFDDVDEYLMFVAKKFPNIKDMQSVRYGRLFAALGAVIKSEVITAPYKKVALGYVRQYASEDINIKNILTKMPKEQLEALDALEFPTQMETPSTGSSVNDNIIDKLNNDDSIDKLEC